MAGRPCCARRASCHTLIGCVGEWATRLVSCCGAGVEGDDLGWLGVGAFAGMTRDVCDAAEI